MKLFFEKMKTKKFDSFRERNDVVKKMEKNMAYALEMGAGDLYMHYFIEYLQKVGDVDLSLVHQAANDANEKISGFIDEIELPL